MIAASALPIDEVVPDIAAALSAGTQAVVVAPPGAGKTTRLPLALLDQPWMAAGKIVLLEPRRLAARAAASRMAATLGEPVGRAIGLKARFESEGSAATRIEVVTEGVFVRMVLDDPSLDGVAAVIFDEFHERSLDADLGLALALDARTLRPDLRLLVMSATLDGARVARLLKGEASLGAPVIESRGRAFPVETRYLGRDPAERIEDALTRAILRALAEAPGSILAFLPGQGEIARVAERLSASHLPSDATLAPLFAAMDRRAQDAAVAPTSPGRRKIVLATSIAETSLTIDGVRIVVDSGLARVPRYEPALGLTRLETVRVSRAAADQRRGRAGRTEPGLCYRLWEEAGTGALEPFAKPAILSADLSGLLLDCAAWGARHPERDLAWLDPPPAPALTEARTMLQTIGALDADGGLTDDGRQIRALALPPRLARMVVLAGHPPLREARGRGTARRVVEGAAEARAGEVSTADEAGTDIRTGPLHHAAHGPPSPSATGEDARGLAAEIATLIVERGLGGTSVDMRDRVERFRHDRSPRANDARALARTFARQARSLHGEEAEGRLEPRLSNRRGTQEATSVDRLVVRDALRAPHHEAIGSADPSAGRLLALAYPDRIAMARGKPGEFLMANGRAAALAPHEALARAPFLAIAEVAGRAGAARILLAAALTESEIEAIAGGDIVEAESLRFDPERGALVARRIRRLGAIVLDESPRPVPAGAKAAAVLAAGIAALGIAKLPWTPAIAQWRDRVAFLRAAEGEPWPQVDDPALAADGAVWLVPHLDGVTCLAQIGADRLDAALKALVPWDLARRLDAEAPAAFETPAGASHRLDYAAEQGPTLSVKVQELYGLAAHPTLAGGRVSIVLELLSPAGRPIQITRDLPGFWRGSWRDVRIEMRGRYPKHVWPEDPAAALPTLRAKPRKT